MHSYEEQRATAVQTVIMAVIVATMLCLPLWGVVALVCAFGFGIPVHDFITFGGRLSQPAGVLAWWAISVVPATVYAIIFRP